MKATLTIGASRLTTDLSPDRLNTVLETFIEQIDDQVHIAVASADDADQDDGALAEDESEEVAGPVETPPPAPPVPTIAIKSLYHFKCPDCGRAPFFHSEPIVPGDILECNCGKKIDVFDVNEVTGSCSKCGNSFWNIGIINGLDSIVCKKCRSPISLVDAGNGQLGPERR